MTLGERCDEIVRLIDETLADYELSALATGGTAVAAVTAVEPPMVTRVRALAEVQRHRLPRSA